MKEMYRRDDPSTSKAGARDVSGRRVTQAMRLLRTYKDARNGLTDDEAASQVDLMHTCYWKRCSELREHVYITPVKVLGTLITRTGHLGSERMVCVITEEGKKKLKEEGL